MGFVQDYGRSYFFTQCRMRAAKSDGGRDRGMPQQNLIHFMRRDVLAAADDDVFDPSRQMQIAVRVKKSFVAGTKPPIHKSASVGFWIVFISTKDIRSLNSDFASLVRAQMITFFVHDADAQSSPHADRTGLPMPRRQRIRSHLVSRFRHSVGFDERHAEEILN